MLNDLRYALRTLRANRLFTAMAVLSLALGIGANTAIYSFMDAILVRTLPVRNPESLVVLQWHSLKRSPVVRSINGSIYDEPQFGRVSPSFPYRVLEILQDNPALSAVASYNFTGRPTALIRGQGSVVDSVFVSGGFFGALDLPAAAGRLIGMEDDRDGAAPVAVRELRFRPAAIRRSGAGRRRDRGDQRACRSSSSE